MVSIVRKKRSERIRLRGLCVGCSLLNCGYGWWVAMWFGLGVVDVWRVVGVGQVVGDGR